MTTFITIQQIEDLMSITKRNLGGFSEEDFLQWGNFLNQELYPQFISINPNDYLARYTFKLDSGNVTFALPSDFKELRTGGFFKTQTGSLAALNYDGLTLPFAVGLTVTGTSSGATGVIIGDTFVTGQTSGTLELQTLSDIQFTDNEIITDSATGSAKVNGTQKAFKYTESRLVETGFGSERQGYWLDSQINITGFENQTEVFAMRYIPDLAELTDAIGVNGTTIIPIAYKQTVKNATDMYWEEVRRNSNMEFLASDRFRQTVRDMFRDIRKTPNILQLPNRTRNYQHSVRRESTLFNSVV